jgi:hypothetical protein
MAAILISGLSVVTTSCSNEDTLVHVTTSVSGTWISVEGYLKCTRSARLRCPIQ